MPWYLRFSSVATASMLRDNLVMNHKVNYMTSALFPAEAVENNQEHLVAMKLGR